MDDPERPIMMQIRQILSLKFANVLQHSSCIGSRETNDFFWQWSRYDFRYYINLITGTKIDLITIANKINELVKTFQNYCKKSGIKYRIQREQYEIVKRNQRM